MEDLTEKVDPIISLEKDISDNTPYGFFFPPIGSCY